MLIAHHVVHEWVQFISLFHKRFFYLYELPSLTIVVAYWTYRSDHLGLKQSGRCTRFRGETELETDGGHGRATKREPPDRSTTEDTCRHAAKVSINSNFFFSFQIMKLWVDTVGRNWQVIFCWGYVFLKLWILYCKFINVRFRKLGDLTWRSFQWGWKLRLTRVGTCLS